MTGLLFTVDILDEANISIVSGRYDAPNPIDISIQDGKFSSLYVFPLLMDPSFTGKMGNNQVNPGTFSETYKVEFDVSLEEMKRMRNVVCKIIRNKG